MLRKTSGRLSAHQASTRGCDKGIVFWAGQTGLEFAASSVLCMCVRPSLEIDAELAILDTHLAHRQPENANKIEPFE